MSAINTNYMISDGGSGGDAHKQRMEEQNRKARESGERVVAKYKSTKTPTGSGSAAGNTGYETGFDYGAYLSELQRAAQARANEAYERNMARIGSAYDAAYGSLRGNYDSTVGRLNAARDKSLGDVNRDAERSLQEAYINNMLTKKNLNQRLSAMGYNGGATESTMASLANQYGNSRNGINETLNDNISNLNMTYGDNLAAALQSFNSAKANLDLQRMQLEMQAENARNNAYDTSMSASMNIDGSYLSALKAALSNQAAYQYDPSQATNDFVAGQAQQAQSASQGNNYAMWMAQQLLSGGSNSATDVSRYLLSKGYNQQTINDILKQLGAVA